MSWLTTYRLVASHVPRKNGENGALRMVQRQAAPCHLIRNDLRTVNVATPLSGAWGRLFLELELPGMRVESIYSLGHKRGESLLSLSFDHFIDLPAARS